MSAALQWERIGASDREIDVGGQHQRVAEVVERAMVPGGWLVRNRRLWTGRGLRPVEVFALAYVPDADAQWIVEPAKPDTGGG